MEHKSYSGSFTPEFSNSAFAGYVSQQKCLVNIKCILVENMYS